MFNFSFLGITIFIILIIAILVSFIYVIRDPETFWNMNNYNDFLVKRKYTPSHMYLYQRKLKKLAKEKSTSEIKEDIGKATTYRKAFIKVYLSRRKKELKNLEINDLLQQEKPNLYEEEIYEDVIKRRLENLSMPELEDIIKTKSYNPYFEELLYKEYKYRFKDDLQSKDIDDLIWMTDNYKGSLLHSDETEKLIYKAMRDKMWSLSDDEQNYIKENMPSYILKKLEDRYYL